MKIPGIIAAHLLLGFSLCGQNLPGFEALLNECGMYADIPPGFLECPIIENDVMGYEYAIKYPEKAFEVRYAVRPIQFKHYLNEEMRIEMEGQREFRNSSYKSILETIIFNLTGGKAATIKELDSAGVRKEFHADWGATCFIELNSTFGEGYPYCMVVAIHKKDMADAYYFYLSYAIDKFSENMHLLFHSMMFNEK